MDPGYNIYELSEEEKTNPSPVVKEDIERLESFLSRRAESDRKKHEEYVRKHGRLIWNSTTQGTYRKSDQQEQSSE